MTAKTKHKKLNVPELKFAEGVLRGMTLVDAYANAGYKGKGAHVSAHKMRKRPHVDAYIAARLSKDIITTDEILIGIRDIAVNAEEKASDRLKAYELLGKNKKLFTEKTETELTGGMTIEVAYVDGDD